MKERQRMLLIYSDATDAVAKENERGAAEVQRYRKISTPETQYWTSDIKDKTPKSHRKYAC